jgi:triosephosphate isomerase
MKYVIANWKANKTPIDVEEWIEIFSTDLMINVHIQSLLKDNKLKIIICPPLPYIIPLKRKIPVIPNLSIGVQNVSHLGPGSHTGEVTAEMLKGVVEYAIIGHSERRREYNETEEMIAAKVTQAAKNAILPILCVRNESDHVYSDAPFIAYEPIEAIGTGKSQSVEEVLTAKQKLPLQDNQHFIYGGSVTEQNSSEYLSNDAIDGVLVGTASLYAERFLSICQQL